MEKFMKDLLHSEVTKLVKEKFSSFAKEAIKDSSSFLQKTEDDIKRWTAAVDAGKMTIKDLKSLLKGKQDLAQMELLTKKGIAQTEIDKFRDAVIDIILKKLL